MWRPTLASGGPKYQALLHALERDIDEGVLPEGTRLPTQRALATHLGIAIGTVSRVYSIAERRGILSGEVGRGTFVRRRHRRLREGADESEEDNLIDLSRARLVGDPGDLRFARTLEILSREIDLHQLIDIYQPPAGMARHRAAGASWIGRGGFEVDPARVVITSGAQHGAFLVLASITQPGDLILTEEVTYSGMRAIAGMLRLRLKALPMDKDGLRPDSLEAACRTDSPRALFCMSTLQNPTGRTMPLPRREELAAIVNANHLTVLEDDVNCFLPAEPLPPIASLTPAHTYYITGTSKSLAPGLRIGYVVAPHDQLEGLSAAVETTTWFTAPLLAEVVTQWIESGDAEEIASRKRSEIEARYLMALEILGPWLTDSRSVSFHLWLTLPEPWRTETFVGQARVRGVLVNSADEFLVDRERAQHAVRVCLGAALSRARLQEGLRRLADLLSSARAAGPMVY